MISENIVQLICNKKWEKGYDNPAILRRKLHRELKDVTLAAKSDLKNETAGTWLKENVHFLSSDAKQIVFSKKSVRKGMISLVADSFLLGFDPSTNLMDLLEMVARDRAFQERELINLPSVFRASLIFAIGKAVKTNPEAIPELITKYHNQDQISFEQIRLHFSPLERLLRQDPGGVYSKMTRETQNEYRNRIVFLAKKEGKTVEKVADQFLEKAKKAEKHIGFYLFEQKSASWYFPLILFVFLLFTTAYFALTESVFVLFFALVPIYFIAKSFVDFFVSRFAKPHPLPSLRTDAVDDTQKTLVVITTLITQKKDIYEGLNKLNQYRLNNKNEGDQIYFGLLCDLPQGNCSFSEKDEELSNLLKVEIEKLNEICPCYFAVMRKRVYHESEDAFVGYERKRGAIEQFVAFVNDGVKPREMLFYGECQIKGAKYLITLDQDTELGIGQAKRLVGMMEHPLNRPVICEENGRKRVVSGHGIIQPRVSCSLLSKITTPYAKIYSNGSGEIRYASASYDTMQTLFGQGNFCGKGILDIACFHQVLKDVIPPQKILSHDMPEGALLRAGLATNEVFVDSDPQNAVSHYKRLHRWIRGDIQNLSILSKLPKLRCAFAVENILRYFLPVSELLLLLISFFVPEQKLYPLLLILAFHFQPLFETIISTLISGNIQIFSRRFKKRIVNLVINSFYKSLISLFAILHEAFYYLDAIIRSAYRLLISKKKLLEWQVYTPYAKGKGDLLFYLPSIVVSSLLFFFVKSNLQFFFCIGFLFYPFAMSLLSRKYVLKEKLSEKERAYLFDLAKKEFSFFVNSANQLSAYLPPDNIQFSPVEKIANRTSPTNIGLYLVSLVAAREMEIIKDSQLCKSLEKAFQTIEKLEHFQGHLFNWYDLSTLGVIGERFISTVDNGNFIASLIVVKNALKKLVKTQACASTLIEKIDKEISECNFNLIFDRGKGLFWVGVYPDEPQRSTSHYDLYMSEARIASFVGIALEKIPAAHWKNLSRPLLSFNGRVGVGSWTGTCFEYYMPSLFFPIVENSMEDESLDFALYCQKNFCANGKYGSVFGISESGYNRTDDAGNLQYYAFGTPYLSCFERGSYKKVISPYSSFLLLSSWDFSVVENLKKLEKMGAVGPFGYYEALDFDSNFMDDYSIVKSYMSHHKGMSVISLCNLLCGNAIQNLFMESPEFSAKTELLAERFPLEEKIMKKKRAPLGEEIENLFTEISKGTTFFDRKKNAVLTDGNLTLLLNRNGKNRVILDGFDLFHPENDGIYCKIILENDADSLCFTGEDLIKTNFGPNFSEFILVKNKISAILRFELISGEKVFLLRLEVNGISQPYQVEIGFDFIYQSEKEYFAHPAFHNLSLEGESNGKELVLVRRLTEGERVLRILSDLNFKTKFYGFSAESSFSRRMLYEPKVVLSFEGQTSRGSVIPILFSLQEEKKNLSDFLDGSYFVQKQFSRLGEDRMRRLDKICQMDRLSFRAQEHLIALSFEKQKYLCQSDTQSMCKEDLWRLGISGDHPMITFVLKEKSSYKTVTAYLKAYKKLQIAGICKLDFVIVHPAGDGYFNTFRSELNQLLATLKVDFLLGKHPGIHVIPANDEKMEKWFSALSIRTFGLDGSQSLLEERELTPVQRHYNNSTPEQEDVGSFLKNEFLIDKEKYHPAVSFSHIISDPYIGFLCNQNSLGFTWFRNAGLNRISKWENIPNENRGEKVYLGFEGKTVDLISFAQKVRYSEKSVVYEGEYQKIPFVIFATVCSELSGKVIFVRFQKDLPKESKLTYSFIPVLGQNSGRNILFSKDRNFVTMKPVLYDEYRTGAYFATDEEIFLSSDGEKICFTFSCKNENRIFLGGFSGDMHLSFLKQKQSNMNLEHLLTKEIDRDFALSERKGDPMEFWSLYQAVHARFYARTGLYQSSGAYGFRDQLQDCLVFLDFAPEITKRHILRCASHQFIEGDVLHWWHSIRRDARWDPGVRTRCSDDYLWLLFAVSEYIKSTDDHKILETKVPFISGEKLKADENERYLNPEMSESETLLVHLEKAVLLFLERGLLEHSLPDIGCGDWNDGMNKIEGESVWLGFFGAICLHRCKEYFSDELKEKIDLFLWDLKSGLENAFNGAWFVRAFAKDGKVYGSDVSLQSECSIDLITQAFASFYQWEFYGTKFELDSNMIKSALISAYDLLVNEKTRTIRLFTKPFSKSVPSPGYIQRYHAGVRENGGQYTHAAVWYAMALILFGRLTSDSEMEEKGIFAADLIDPSVNVHYENFKRYQREPYVLCGDIYDAHGFRGHGGWSWYTGAAGWYYRLLKMIKNKEKKLS